MDNESQSPFELDGWLEFNRLKWGVQPLRARYDTGEELPAIRAVLYADRHGRVVLPRLNPYLPVSFKPTPTEKRYRLDRQWLDVATAMAQDMRDRGLRGSVNLSPQVTDARPWGWAGFRVGVAYTIYVDLPFDPDSADHAVARQAAKARRAGYRVERATKMADALASLQETENRQGFRYGLTLQDLEKLRNLLGDEHLRAYVCYSPRGKPACSRLVLHVPGSQAADWVVGTCTADLNSGATQLTIEVELQDLQNARAGGFDFEGANLPSVAAAKALWGGRLVPHATVETYNLRTLGRWGLSWLRFRRVGRGP